MKQMIKISGYLAVFLIALSCSSGGGDDVSEVYSVSGNVIITDMDYLTDNEDIRFGVFNAGETQALSSVKLAITAQGKGSFYMKNIKKGSYEFKIYLAKNGRNIVNLLVYSSQSVKEDLVLKEKNMTLVSYRRVQKQVFNSCMVCHGDSSGEVAANLNLLPTYSYNNLVNVKATNSSLFRVKPFSTKESFMINVLHVDGISFKHQASISASASDKKLVENWIRKGALND